MVVRDGAVAGCGMALVRELWRPEVHYGGCCMCIRDRFLGDEDEDVARSEWSIGLGDLILGDRPSRLGKCVSPKREPMCGLSDFGCTSRARCISYERGMGSPKREGTRLSETSWGCYFAKTCSGWVKHVAFYGLWPGMTSLELWFGIADEQEEPLSFCSCWRVLLVTLRTMFVIWELHLALRCVIRSMVSARALSVMADRCGSKAP
ncbi:hypothetical protein DEO72_LG9g1771 [Vigna unguiculata]|uniref:Uncharacterized protein n=1 Tax=Vigna unguiculata TaxID=3917 RepID=A0A4D6N414_VIGUN|nr:hypothetical protein DEO72_LG9g1771 [Vigna unguiculata]